MAAKNIPISESQQGPVEEDGKTRKHGINAFDVPTDCVTVGCKNNELVMIHGEHTAMPNRFFDAHSNQQPKKNKVSTRLQ